MTRTCVRDRFLSVSQRSFTSSALRQCFSIKTWPSSCRCSFSRTVFVSLKSSLPSLILAPRSSSGLLPPGHHHLQLQPAAERMGIHPLVQHDQPGHQGPTLRWTTCSPRCLLHLGWKRLFSQDVMFFANCPAATWPQFGEMLSWQFLAAAKRELAEEQLQMIARKLFGTTAILSSFVRSMTASIHVCRNIWLFWDNSQVICLISVGIKNVYDNCNVAWSKFTKVRIFTIIIFQNDWHWFFCHFYCKSSTIKRHQSVLGPLYCRAI